MKIDPAKLSEYSKEKLVKFYVEARDRAGTLEATRRIVGEELLGRIKDDGEVIGNYGVAKRKRYNWKIDLEKARELGATKTEEKIDNDALRKLLDNGVKIEHTVTEWPDVREIE